MNIQPGLREPTIFHQFSGYFTVNETNGRYIHYLFAESQNDPENDPVVFWTNGGPGCSGLFGYGTEHGPFLYPRDGKGHLTPNPFSWNRLANMLYIEQPSGVGYSYSNTPTDYKTGDSQAAADNFVVLQEFFKRFPQLISNGFYVASESYGGHYVPQLTLQILRRDINKQINFRGFLVGNPYVDPEANTLARYQTFYSHGVIAKPMYDEFVQNCATRGSFSMDKCFKIQGSIFKTVKKGGINPYGLDFPVCLDGMTESQKRTNSLHSSSSQSKALWKKSQIEPPFLPLADKFKPCEEHDFTIYINRVDVRQALHVPLDMVWNACNEDLDYSVDDFLHSKSHLYREIINMGRTMQHDLKMLVYSGDDDGVCPLTGTQQWIYDLGVLPMDDHLWVPWKVDGQLAGYLTDFDMGLQSNATFSLATVHGAGHEVPSYRPKEALKLFESYLRGEWPTSKS
jgi:carboxypeptidase C (cathepsin A)